MLRAHSYGYSEDPSNSFVERRQALAKNITSLRDPQRLYMSGTDSPNIIDPIVLADHPENVELWLPSALPLASRDAQCIEGLPELEYRLRFAQAADALHNIRLYRRLLRTLTIKSQIHITNTQRTSTRSRSIFDKAKAKLAQAVATYRASRKAIMNLASNEEFGSWKDVLQELKDCDIRGPGREESETSESRFVPSWIWTTVLQTLTSAEDPDLNDTLRIEWCKAQERAKRYEEEVELVVEEMRRTLVTFELNACEWDQRATSISLHTPLASAVTTGATAYAHKQADIQRNLIKVFINDWYEVLEKQPLASSWLRKYPRPPEYQRHRLICNVRRYHSNSPAPGNTARISDISPSCSLLS